MRRALLFEHLDLWVKHNDDTWLRDGIMVLEQRRLKLDKVVFCDELARIVDHELSRHLKRQVLLILTCPVLMRMSIRDENLFLIVALMLTRFKLKDRACSLGLRIEEVAET